MLTIYNGERGGAESYLNILLSRRDEKNKDVLKTAEKILEDVKKKGDQAVRDYTLQFDGKCPERFEVPKEEIISAYESAEDRFKTALINAKKNITAYHEKQKREGYEQKGEGYTLGQIIRPLKRVGVYVPGGTASYPSTVLMNVIPAKIAGVEEILMITPPAKDGKARKDLLTAAYIAGVDRVFLAGGAQGIAALTYGTETIPAVDKIVGPGNLFVAAAKRLVFGLVDIDMIAGPSEILVLADESANPAFVAADLLSQAEHDKAAAAVLLTTSEEFAQKVNAEIISQVSALSRAEIITESLKGFGGAIVCESIDEMFKLSNKIAPEHLEIMLKNPESYLPLVQNAGSVFLGAYAPEPLGDYYSGTNHVLPTSGTARFSSPLGVDSFLKKMSYTKYSREALSRAKDDILIIANKEGLTAHAAAIERRFL